MLLKICSFITRYFPFIIVLLSIVAYLTPHQAIYLVGGVNYYIGIVMLAMGLTMSINDFKMVFSHPRMVVLAVCLRYVLMPVVALAVSKVLGLSPALAAGFILVGCCPSAVASNVMTFLSKGNTALSVTVSTCNTILSPFVTPFIFLLLAGSLVHVNAESMLFDISKIVLLPVVLGVGLRVCAERFVKHVTPYLPALSTIQLILIVMAGVALNADRLADIGIISFVGVALHNGIGLGLGFLIARKVFRMAQRDSQAVAFEVGMENTGLAVALIIGHLDPIGAIPAAIFGLWHNVTGSVLADFWASRSKAEQPSSGVAPACPTAELTSR
jgi:bile acid:Na+ symporter, BASS family